MSANHVKNVEGAEERYARDMFVVEVEAAEGMLIG